MESKIAQLKLYAAQNFLEKEISELMGIARGTVKLWAKKNNIKVISRSEWLTARQDQIVILYTSGKTVNQIRDLGYSYELIKKTANERNLAWRDSLIRGKERRLSDQEVLSRIPNSEGFKVIGYERSPTIGRSGKYIIQSLNGKIFKKTSHKLSQGLPTNVQTVQDFAAKLLEKTGRVLMQETYSGTKQPCSFICPNGHVVDILSAENALHHSDCKICNNSGVSKAELAIAAWIESLGIKTERFYFEREGSGRRKELDVYIPSLKLGIEYCGLYWHNEERLGKKYHSDKLKLANDHGIRLIIIFEDEWLERESQVKNFLKSVLNQSSISFFARKCKIQQIDKKSCDQFMNMYHIQGKASGSIASFGIYHNDELLGVISGSNHHRAGHNDLVLDRLCFKDDTTIVGGSSRLLKSLIGWGKENGFRSMISWSDNRWSEGNVYIKMGFTLDDELKPDYSYIKENGRISKQSCKKSAIAKKWPEVYSPEKTEAQMMKEVGYPRIWDCGKKRWSMVL